MAELGVVDLVVCAIFHSECLDILDLTFLEHWIGATIEGKDFLSLEGS